MTISFQGWPFPERLLKSAWVTSEPPDSIRSRSPLRDETISNCPSGSQSKHIGNDGKLTLTITSLLPSRLTALISCAPQSATHRRPSCQRGDSPKARPVTSLCSSGIGRLLLTQPLCSSFCLHLARRNRRQEVDQQRLLASCSSTNRARIHAPIVPVLPDLTQTIMPLAFCARQTPRSWSGLRAQFGLTPESSQHTARCPSRPLLESPRDRTSRGASWASGSGSWSPGSGSRQWQSGS